MCRIVSPIWDLPGLEFDPAEKRYYPQGFAAVQVIGSTDPDGNGTAGLELGLDRTLKSSTDGVAVSLDMRVQYALSHEIEEARKEFGARAAGGIVLNVNTGEILAMASLPDSESDPSVLQGVDPRRNLMAADDYELGSVFKIFAFALAMEDHTIRLDETFPIGGGFKIGRFTIHEAEHMPADAGRARYPGAVLQPRHGADRAALRPHNASASSWAASGFSPPSARELPEAPVADLSPEQLGPGRNGHHRLRPRHFGDPARLRHGGGDYR